jgi:hypothetical protein
MSRAPAGCREPADARPGARIGYRKVPMARQVRPAGRLLLAALSCAAVCACDAHGPPRGTGRHAPAASDVTASAARSNPGVGPPTVRVATLTGAGPNEAGAGAYRYRVEYPQLDGLDGRVQRIDRAIQGTLQRDVDDFVDTARAAPAGPGPSELDCRSRIVRLTARLAVARVDCSQHQAGATRTDAVIHTFNCDLGRSRVLALQDLFRVGSAYLSVISGAARAQLGPLRAGDERALAEGTAPAAANFQDFLLEQDALVIVFARYPAAPGTTDHPEVSVPYSALARYLAPGIPELAE